MTNLEAIEQQVKGLSPKELAEFRDWFLDFEWDAWDRQLERDSKGGKLDALAQKAREEHAAGRTKSL